MSDKHRFILLAVILSFTAQSQAAGQKIFTDYFEALPIFWDRVYGTGGETLYCGQRFGKRRNRGINIEHVFPMAWVKKAEGCRSRKHCRNTSRRFNRIEADLHNLYPARQDINKARSSLAFAIIPGERRSFGRCDFEIDERQRLVEPRPASRGNIARAIFYMHDTYGLNIFRRQGKLLQRWNREDPPDAAERQRNDRIEKIQHTRNRFIDNPGAANRLRF